MATPIAARAFKGFRYAGVEGHPEAQPVISYYQSNAAGTYRKGDIVNLSATGKLSVAATNSATLFGLCMATKTVAANGLVPVAHNIGMRLSVYDANARQIGANLDISGSSGSMSVGTATNNDLKVVQQSDATQPTIVILNPAEKIGDR